MADQDLLADLSDVVDSSELDNMVQGVARDRAGRRDAVRGADEHQRQEHRVLPEAAVRGGRVRGAHDLRRARGPQRRDPGHRDDPLVLRHRVRGGDRLAGHRLGREPDGDQQRRRRLQRVGQPRDPVQRRHRRRDAASRWTTLLLAEGRTNGGRPSIASNNFGTAAFPLFDEPPGCFMYRQGNFVAQEGVFPDEVIADIDNVVGVFAMPGLTAEDKPVLGGGDLAGIFSKDNESAQKLVAVPGVGGLRDDGVRGERQLDLPAHGLRRRACTRRRPGRRSRRSPTSRPSSSSTAPTRCPVRSGRVRSGAR